MKKIHKKAIDVNYESKTLAVALIDTQASAEDFDKKDLKTRSAYFALNGAPTFSVNEKGNARFQLLTNERDFFAAKQAGFTEFTVNIYHFSEKRAEAFVLIERLKSENLGIMDEAYMIKKLMQNHKLTQNDVADFIDKSRPAIANTLRLLTLTPEVIGLIESGKLSAGHARTLVRVPQDKQLAFATEAIKRGLSVREMERAVKAYLTPPEVLKREKEAKDAANSERLKIFVEKLRALFETKVSLIGNDKKGRIYIDYYTPEDLVRIETILGVADIADEQLSMFPDETKE